MMIAYVIKDQQLFRRIQGLARAMSVVIFFAGLSLSAVFGSGLFFILCFFLAWLISYFIVGRLIVDGSAT